MTVLLVQDSRLAWRVSFRGARQNPSLGRRRGVTLLEVLFSIGIVAVGLLGVLVIIPLAGSRSTQGMIADGADRMGRNAVRMFDVQHMRDPTAWAYLVPTTKLYHAYGKADPAAPALPTYLWKPGPADLPRARSFCIDPLFISNQLASSGSNPIPVETRLFPYYNEGFSASSPPAGVDARLDRISLYAVPGGTAGMSLEQAISIFMGSDDLVFSLGTDRTAAPQQKFDSTSGKRQFEGKFSWMATLTPVFTALETDPPSAIKRDVAPERYVLSIVVLHRRDLALTSGGGSASEPDNERLVRVSSFASEGYGGGDVELATHVGRPECDLTCRVGQWVMLSAMVNIAPSTPTPVFRWYRVMAVDEIQQASPTGPYTRNVTLQGFDWDNILRLQMLASPQATMTQATLLNGVVAVYEKTIELETSSMWSAL